MVFFYSNVVRFSPQNEGSKRKKKRDLAETMAIVGSAKMRGGKITGGEKTPFLFIDPSSYQRVGKKGAKKKRGDSPERRSRLRKTQ